jgi:hypothetical protein
MGKNGFNTFLHSYSSIGFSWQRSLKQKTELYHAQVHTSKKWVIFLSKPFGSSTKTI